ncbi:tubulin-tyrosine ligase family-domain-containing protein [Chytriomyces sp. MP71]|nr:tubulin-tyrosine ligase family-domain-containing protein [Chytriomyces sp. MP71]
MKSVSAGRKCESAQKYGIAVMIDDEAAIGSDGNDDQHRIKLKPAIVASLFDDGDAVLYFPKEGETVGKIPAELKDAMKWKICKFTPRVIRTCLRRAGFKLVKGGKKWIGYWGKHYPAEKFKTVQPWQKVNHYPMSFEIGRKDKMYLNVCRMRERVKDDCMGLDFLPATYFLPSQRRRLKNAFSSHPSWIIKPPASARGIGIRVVNKWKDVPQRKEFIVSKYIQNPYLIDKKKFDIRLYVVVTSFDPLRVYLFKEGIVRFAGEKYSTSSSKNSIKNRFIHLTNYSVSRKKKSKHPTELPSFPFGDPMFSTSDSKWSLDLLQKYFTRQGINFQKVLENIKHAIVSTVISSHAANSSGTRMYAANVSSCYELFGFDVLLDANLKPWVMEVNISPSLKASCDMDMAVKSRLAVDLFNLVGVRVKDLDASQKKQKKKSYQRPFLTIAERQKMRHFSLNTDFNLLLDLTDHDLRILKESEDENRRRGDFERIFPFVDSSPYFKLFASTPYSDHLLLQWIKIAHVNPIKAYNLLRRSSQFASSAYSSSPHHSSQHLVDSHTGNRSISARLNASGTSTTFKSSTLSVHTVPNFAKDTIVSASRKSSAQVRRNTLLKNDGENIVAMNAAINALESVAIHPQTMEALHVDTTGACLKHELYTPPHHILQEDDPALPLTGMPHLFRGAANPTLYPETSQGHPYATFPERQTMTLNKPSIILSSSNTMLVPGVATTSYVLKPRKISSKPKPEIDHSANQVPPQIMTETAARVISREMQQQQHYHLQHQRFYEQQQLLYLQQHQELQHEYQQQSQPHESFLPRFPSPKDISKEYPSTIAYKAAMAIANVTARFRAIEGTGHGVGGINQKLEVLPEPNYLRREMSQAELMAWAAMTQQQHFRQQEQQQQQQYDMQQHVPHLKPFSNVKIGKEGPFVVETGAASSFIRSRRLMNTPATASRPITGKRI